MTWALTAIAVLLIAYAAVSKRLERANVSTAMFFTTTGLLVGPALGLLDLQVAGEQVKLLAEITLTLVLFADASRISLRALRRRVRGAAAPAGHRPAAHDRRRSPGRAPVIPGVSVAEALVLAIVLACTDAALGQAVVSDERVPSRIRQGLNVESGLNDGLCVPLFFIAIAIAETDAGTTSAHVARQARVRADRLRARRRRRRRERSAPRAALADPPAADRAALAADPERRLGAARRRRRDALGGSIFIAAFTGGFLFGALRRDTGGEVSYLVDEGGELFNAVTFIVFGAVILGPLLDEVTWQIVLYAVLSLTVVRMLPVALAMLGHRRSPSDGGVPRLVRAARPRLDRVRGHPARRHRAPAPGQTLLLAITVTIALSVYAHGLTARPLTERYTRWWNSHPRDASSLDG